MRKLLLGVLPLLFLFIYWCPLTGMLFMKLLGENVYWRILWLILLAVLIPYGFCLVIGRLKGWMRQAAFLIGMAVIVLCGKPLLKSEEFQASTNPYKLPQYVIEVGDILPNHVHAIVSNRIMPYIRQYRPDVTLEYARNALAYNGIKETNSEQHLLYLEAQKDIIDLETLIRLGNKVNVDAYVLSVNKTYEGSWEEYNFQEYGRTADFVIYVSNEYSGS